MIFFLREHSSIFACSNILDIACYVNPSAPLFWKSVIGTEVQQVGQV